MVTAALRRELERRRRRSDRVLPGVVRRLVAGRDPQPWWLPRRVATVVAFDLDLDAGVAAVRLVWRPGSARAEPISAVVERSAGRWTETGGGAVADEALPGPRCAVGSGGQLGVIDLVSSCGLRSWARTAARPGHAHEAPWVGTTELRVAAEADRLVVGDREVAVPAHGTVLLAWISPPAAAAVRPPVVALASDGAELSRLAPGDVVDSYTWGLLAAP
ncbi:hypothetical protein [Streptomyces sp. NBC_01198]|uniref:hypothetical protein n=1 Tax=Streptomyces sp. NBC_01198 TaxID=2903769 RepID=UPI002E1093C4|nr:hypothetical protein OG702_33290 [Streptomyces sp. NBC_01198]